MSYIEWITECGTGAPPDPECPLQLESGEGAGPTLGVFHKLIAYQVRVKIKQTNSREKAQEQIRWKPA